MLLRLAEVVRRSCRRQVGTKYTLRNRLVVWSTAISTSAIIVDGEIRTHDPKTHGLSTTPFVKVLVGY